MQPNFLYEQEYSDFCVVGIDEAGRGPLAGPVVAACVILNQNDYPAGINDSKKLSKKQRQEILFQIKEKAKFGIGIVDEKIIDEINILEATKLAMLKAFDDLTSKNKIVAQVALVDGNFIPFVKENVKIISVVKGDQKSLSIAAASILAKETRDEIMRQIDKKYPQYGFAKHSGYGTKFHRDKIKECGICEFHRRSFEPIKSMLNENS